MVSSQDTNRGTFSFALAIRSRATSRGSTRHPNRSAAVSASVHPHHLRHTLATQAINRGMRLEAIAALLGHRSMEMTLTYARIADRVVADEYEAVFAQIDALYIGAVAEESGDVLESGAGLVVRQVAKT